MRQRAPTQCEWLNKLRGENAEVAAEQVFVQPPRHRDVPQHFDQAVISLPTPTAHIADIFDAPSRAMDQVFREGFSHQRT